MATEAQVLLSAVSVALLLASSFSADTRLPGRASSRISAVLQQLMHHWS
jgi:hypothetical protein